MGAHANGQEGEAGLARLQGLLLGAVQLLGGAGCQDDHHLRERKSETGGGKVTTCDTGEEERMKLDEGKSPPVTQVRKKG